MPTEDGHSTTTFDGSKHRSDLLQCANYVASADFPELWKWERGAGSTPSKLIVDDDDSIEDVYCRVVGVVDSGDRPYLEPHGNFKPKFDAEFEKCKLQFTLKKPDDPDFNADYMLAYRRLEAVQDRVARGSDRSFFLADGTMRFSYFLWEPKVRRFAYNLIHKHSFEHRMMEIRVSYLFLNVDPKPNPAVVERTRGDTANHGLRRTKRILAQQIRIMRVLRWGTHKLLDPERFARSLLGASALVNEIVILRPPPPTVRSPFDDRKIGGALAINQSPKKSPKKTGQSSNELEQVPNAHGLQAKQTDKRKRGETDAGVGSSSKKGKEV